MLDGLRTRLADTIDPRPRTIDLDRLVRALELTGHVGDDHSRAISLGLDPDEHRHEDCLFHEPVRREAEAILRAL